MQPGAPLTGPPGAPAPGPPPPAPSYPSQPWSGPVAVAAAVLAGTAVLAVVNPNTTHVPLCPLKAATGLDCPFCGSLRAVHSLTRADVVGAADHNLLFTLSVPFLIAGWAWWFARTVRGPDPASARLVPARSAVIAFWAVVVVFGVVRNLPAFSWLGST